MSRRPILDAPAALHHIMISGIERRNRCDGAVDPESFLRRLGERVPHTQTARNAKALKTNRAQSLFKTGPVPMSTLIRRLPTHADGGFREEVLKPLLYIASKENSH